MTTIYSGSLSCGGYIGPRVALSRPGQRTIIVDAPDGPCCYAPVWEVRADQIFNGVMCVSMRDIRGGKRGHFRPANPLRERRDV